MFGPLASQASRGPFVAQSVSRRLVQLVRAFAFLTLCCGGLGAAHADDNEGVVETNVALSSEIDVESDEDAFRPWLPPVAIRPLSAADMPPSGPLFARGPSVLPRTNATFGRDWQAGRNEYRAIVEREAGASGVPPALIDAVMAVESRYNPAVIGKDGEIGLMQVMPATARMMGFAGSDQQLVAPEINIHYGAKYLAGAWRLAREDLCTATMKYRAGHGETRFSFLSVNYCIRVRNHLSARGVAISGEVPTPTFGSLRGPSHGRIRSLVAGSSVDISALNIRLRELTEKVASHH